MRLFDKLRMAEQELNGPNIDYGIATSSSDLAPDWAKRCIIKASFDLLNEASQYEKLIFIFSCLTRYFSIAEEHDNGKGHPPSEPMDITPLESSARLIASFKEFNPSAKSVSVTYNAGNLSSTTTVKFEE